MSIGIVFWIIMIILLVFGFLVGRPAQPGQPWNWGSFGMSLVVFVLLALLCWKVFGPALHN